VGGGYALKEVKRIDEQPSQTLKVVCNENQGGSVYIRMAYIW
jgi:hypothetical protein